MADGDPVPPKARYLARWTRLSDSDFQGCYKSVFLRGRARSWELLVGSVPPADLKQAACVEAFHHGFLEMLAEAVANWEAESGRDASEIVAMIAHVAADSFLHALIDERKGLLNSKIFLSLVQASKACAQVRIGGDRPGPRGTAFLVAPDMVLTAAHVVTKIDDSDGAPKWSADLLPDLEFHFESRPGEEGMAAAIFRPAASNALVCHARPHGFPPDALDSSLAAPADTKLDYALIRLAQTVEHVAPVKIVDAVKVEKGKHCFALGFPGGGMLAVGIDSVAEVHDSSGRWLHFANTTGGMSGGCCVNHLGQVAGLHEGAYDLPPALDEEPRTFNRSISLAAIRRAQCAGGRDPLKAKAKTSGLEFADTKIVLGNFRSGQELGGPALAPIWEELFADAVGVDQAAGETIPSFHPWFRRDRLESWIDSSNPAQRLCAVHGARGTGKSFCVNILREKLNHSGADLLHLGPTKTMAMDWRDAMDGALESEDVGYRTTAAKLRYADIDAVVSDLARRSIERTRKRWVVLDFGPPSPGRNLAASEWFALITALLMNDWIRVLVVDLGDDERFALQDLVLGRSETSDLEWTDVELAHVTRTELVQYAVKLAQARGSGEAAPAVREQVAALMPDFSGVGAAQPLQTAAAALAMIRWSRRT